MKIVITILLLHITFVGYGQIYDMDRSQLIKTKSNQIAAEQAAADREQQVQDSIAVVGQKKSDSLILARLDLSKLEGVTTINDFAYFPISSLMQDSEVREEITAEFYLDEEFAEMRYLLELNKRALTYIMIKALLQTKTKEQYEALQESQKVWEKYSKNMIAIKEGQIQEIGSGSSRKMLRTSYALNIYQQRVSELIDMVFVEETQGAGYTWDSVLKELLDRLDKESRSTDGG